MMERTAKTVEGQHNGQETTAAHGRPQIPSWAAGVQGLPAYFDFSNQKSPHNV